MPENFNMDIAPFNRLSQPQQTLLQSSLDIAYFRGGEIVLPADKASDYLHILIKGVVEERAPNGSEIFAHYTHDDLFDVRALFEPQVKHQYTALEDTLSYLLPKAVFLKLYEANLEFAAYFDNNLARRQQLLESAHQQQNLAEFILTKVDSSIYHPALILAPDLSLSEVTYQLKQNALDAALIELPAEDERLKQHPKAPPYGIVTRTNMLHAIMLDGKDKQTPIADICTFPVFHVDDGDFLFNAMITMTRHRMKRVMVCKRSIPVGMLDMTQILSSFSTHSHVLTLSIARATSIEELALAANRQRQLVDGLLANGIRTRFIMELISAVNEQIIEKAFELVVPESMQDQCCLVVLGSEGRGEQILKTDQDNALILNNGLQWQHVEPVMSDFSHTLQQLGYPPCPGQVMVNNEQWVKTEQEWQQTIAKWCQSSQGDDLMRLGIFADALAVAGNKSLLPPIKAHLSQYMVDNELLLSEFTKPALSFSVPLTLFGQVKSNKEGIDVKRGGIFPIIHGIRALSLEYGVEENNTFERIERLVKKRILEQETGDNLSEALKQFFNLRLAQQLALNHSHNNIDTKLLDRTERDLLRHSLHVVKKFKQWLSYHYQIRD